MTKRKDILLLLFSDSIAIIVTYIIYFYIRVESGWIISIKSPSFFAPLIVMYLYWIFTFSISDLYQYWFVRSRFDEFTAIFKTITISTLILFFIILVDDVVRDDKAVSRFLILIYWGLLIFFVALGRMIIRGMHISLLRKGIGLRNTIIIGTNDKAIELKSFIEKHPQNGFKFVGFISTGKNENNELVIGNLSDIRKIVKNNDIQEIIVASDPAKSDIMFEVINNTSDLNVGLKIMPDLYEIISGMAKTKQIFGVPLIDVMPKIMNFRLKLIKRIIDIVFSLFILIFCIPLFIIFAVTIKLTSKGPVFHKQTRVGKSGKLFTIYKFRTMYIDAEPGGPIWADINDPRVTKVGRIMRRFRFDEFPQFFNVLKNDMSIVGPRPERPYFVEYLKQQFPCYMRRLNIKPGITGWAQVNHSYDATLDDVKTKLNYDFYYIENMSISLDFKIMLNTVFVILTMKGR